MAVETLFPPPIIILRIFCLDGGGFLFADGVVKIDKEPVSETVNGLKVGDRVTHPVFKEGTITDISLSEEAIFIQFDSLASPRGIALRAARKLKKSSS